MQSSSDVRLPAGNDEAAQAGRYRARSTVLSARVLDGVILLDLHRESYMTLNEVAADIWERVAEGMGMRAIVDWLCARYEVSREDVTRDVTWQVDEFLRLGLIEPRITPGRPVVDKLPHQKAVRPQRPLHSHAGPAPLPTHGQCLAALLGIKARLWLEGYGRTLSWLRGEAEAVIAAERVDSATARAAEFRVAMVCALYPGRARCLEQSLTLYALLRRSGVAVKYRHGVKRYPFQAHAWVEYQGQVINDVPEHVEQFATLPDQLP